MAITQLLLVCLGLCLLGKQADAQPALTATTITVAENVASTVGSVAASGSPQSVTISSEPYDGQFTVAVNGANDGIDFTLTSGFFLDYEQHTTYTVVILMVDATPATGTGTVTITVTDVVEEFSHQQMGYCISGTSIATGTTLATATASMSSVTAVYSITAQTPDVGHLAMDASTGAITVASGKTLTSSVSRVYMATIRLISSAPSVTTSTATVYFLLDCSSGASTLMVGSLTMMLAALVGLLQ